MDIFDKKRRVRLAGDAKKAFLANGWKVEASEFRWCEFSVAKGRLRFVVQCIDGSVKPILKTQQIVAKTKAISERLTQSGFTLVSVFDEEFDNYSFTSLAERGMAAVSLKNLHLVTNIGRFWTELPSTITASERLLIEQSLPLVLSICDRFSSSNEKDRALDWARRAVNATPHFSPLYKRLFDLLYEVGDLSGAEQVGAQALAMSPDDVAFLPGMQKLAMARGDVTAAGYWEKRLAGVVQNPEDAVSFLLNRKAKIFSPGNCPERGAASGQTESDNLRGRVKKWFFT